MPVVHTVLVCFNNPARTYQRWVRDVLPGLIAAGVDWCVTCIDNSTEPSKNLQYGGAINRALSLPRMEIATADYVLYACSNHGQMLNQNWVRDLLQPFDDPAVAMTGHLRGSNSPEGIAEWLGGGPENEWVKEKYRFVHEDGAGYVPQHVQGGVFAARTTAMWSHPYAHPFLGMYSDHFITWELLKAGYKVADVPSILSVWRETVQRRPDGLKYLHDSSEGQ